ncbi:MAG TPA: hypothetical protein PKH93_14855, partial [Chitinophagales bacterium]|nr:hypothetical protein [Chitinophagales bacterium]
MAFDKSFATLFILQQQRNKSKYKGTQFSLLFVFLTNEKINPYFSLKLKVIAPVCRLAALGSLLNLVCLA